MAGDAKQQGPQQQQQEQQQFRPRDHIYRLSVVRAKPFFGYCPSEQRFIKIELLDPGSVRKSATILQSGAVMGQPFQPYESHVPFLLAFLIDNNLYGMDCVDMISVTFRRPLPAARNSRSRRLHRWLQVSLDNNDNNNGESPSPSASGSGPELGAGFGLGLGLGLALGLGLHVHSHSSSEPRLWLAGNTPTHMLGLLSDSCGCILSDCVDKFLALFSVAASIHVHKTTWCELEVDGLQEHILNRKRIVTTRLDSLPLTEDAPPAGRGGCGCGGSCRSWTGARARARPLRCQRQSREEAEAGLGLGCRQQALAPAAAQREGGQRR